MRAVQGTISLEDRVSRWRAYLLRRKAVTQVDVDELEDHLRGHVADLARAGLADDEAFLVAVRRIGDLDEVTREFAREHSERLWKQLETPVTDGGARGRRARTEAAVVFGLALAAALSWKALALFGIPMAEETAAIYARNASLFVLPFLFAYFAWKRDVSQQVCMRAGVAFAAAAVCVNLYPFAPDAATQILAALHLPIALWLVIGTGYAGGRWGGSAERMNFIRFSGELFIYFVLIALGGAVLTGMTVFTFLSIGVEAENLVQFWLIPCGAIGAVIVASWLVEAKQSVIENMAPVLTRLFTPLFALVLLAFLGTMAWTRSVVDVERDVLIGFDLLLAVVLGLVLYSVSARDRHARPDVFDGLQLVLIVCALVVDIVALAAIASRISEFGLSPNKVAALGENLVLLVNLGWSAWLYLCFLRGRRPFADLERWQTAYLPVYSAWAAIVVLCFPPLFGYV